MGLLGKIKEKLKDSDLFRERVSIKLRLSGWVYIFLTLVLGFAAVNSGNNVTYLIVSILLALMSISGFLALFNLLGVDVVPYNEQDILTVGKDGYIYFYVLNRKKIPSFLLDLEIHNLTKRIPFISPSKRETCAIYWLPDKRGVYRFTSVKIGSSFPFGFIWRGLVKALQTEVTVAPAALEFPLPISDGARGIQGKNMGQGTGEWLGIRNYKKGEPIGSIIWKKVDWNFREFQKVLPPFPSHHLASEEMVMRFDIDSDYLKGFSLEKKLSIIRYWLDYAYKNNLYWEIIMGNHKISGYGKNSYDKALKLLAVYGSD